MDKKEFEKSKIFDVNSLIEYANEGIVSKTIINKSSGTITLFAFDKGESLSEHTAPFDALVHVIDGKANIIINKQKHTLKAGESIIMPANIPHAVEAIERFKMELVMIKEK